MAATNWPTDGLSYGGDYNPEQWSEDVWLEDVELMREAGVNLVSVGIFAWGSLEPREGEFEFGWLDRVLELLHGAGIAVDLATPTASPPIWLHRKHPDILPVTRTGQRYAQGGRLGWCASHPVWREQSLRVVRVMAERYGDHPAVRMWHVGNEFGGGNRFCYCDHSAAHFQRWLTQRFATVDALNAAWGTAFWGHRYAEFGDVLPPRDGESPGNPSLELDFRRFASDALLEQFIAERRVLRELSPDRPVTTNFMVGRGPHVVDYAGWAADMDVLANDHYTYTDDDARAQDVAFAADRMRGLARATGTEPWLLMEHSASAVSWQPRNRAKDPGELARNSLAHVARGSDGALFFQWRQSASGAEQFHSAMVPHAGRDTRVWREVVELGATLRDLSGRGLTTTHTEPARVALIMDDAAGWAWQTGPKPHQDLDLAAVARAYHRALWERNVLVDVVPPAMELDGYDVVLVPGLFLVDGDLPARLDRAARNGAQVVVGFLSGIVDGFNRVLLGGYPGAFRDLLGVVSEEFRPLRDDQTATLDNGWTATAWTEHVRLTAGDAETIAAYTDGVLEGLPAVTRRPVGDGAAWYVSARLDDAALSVLLTTVTEAAAVRPTADAPPGVEVVRRIGDDGAGFLFALNHSDTEVTVLPVGADPVSLAAGAATVIDEQHGKAGR